MHVYIYKEGGRFAHFWLKIVHENETILTQIGSKPPLDLALILDVFWDFNWKGNPLEI